MEPFGKLLTRLRQSAQLTNIALAERACVPASLIAGLQSGCRRVGECQARRIGIALGLAGKAIEAFTLRAIGTSTEKVMNDAKGYPAEIINLLPLQLRSVGITPDHLERFECKNGSIELHLQDGSVARLETSLS